MPTSLRIKKTFAFKYFHFTAPRKDLFHFNVENLAGVQQLSGTMIPQIKFPENKFSKLSVNLLSEEPQYKIPQISQNVGPLVHLLVVILPSSQNTNLMVSIIVS